MSPLALVLLTSLVGRTDLEFSSDHLRGWEGDGFALVASGSGRLATSQDGAEKPRKAILHRTFVLPASAAYITFRAALIRPEGTPNSEALLDIVLEGGGRSFAPREVREGEKWIAAPALLPPENRKLREYRWQVEKFAGKRVRIALVDQDDRPGCYLLSSGFQVTTRDEIHAQAFARDMARLQQEHGLPRISRHDSKHFIALSNTSTADTEYRLENCETLYDSFFDHFRKRGFAVRPPAEKLMVAIFNSQKGFEAYLGQNPGDAITGVYHTPTNRLVVYDFATNNAFVRGKKRFEEVARSGSTDLERQQRSVTLGRYVRDRRDDTNLSTIMHEVAHQLSFNGGLLTRGGDAPAWLTEGLAMYCESTRRGVWQGIGEPNPQRAETLAQQIRNRGELLSLRALVSNDDWLRKAHRVDQVVLGYAQSWALFRLLMEERPTQLRAYIESLRARKTAEHRLADFVAGFGTDLTRLDKRYQEYLREIARKEVASRP
ncbi:MAG: DUF1570 domain-containing protein [Gemmataceae bacterium]